MPIAVLLPRIPDVDSEFVVELVARARAKALRRVVVLRRGEDGLASTGRVDHIQKLSHPDLAAGGGIDEKIVKNPRGSQAERIVRDVEEG
jgi:hypothetical protein